MHTIAAFFRDRMQINALLIVLCFVSVLLLRTQSGASYATYLLVQHTIDPPQHMIPRYVVV